MTRSLHTNSGRHAYRFQIGRQTGSASLISGVVLALALAAGIALAAPASPSKGPWMDKSLSPDRRAELVLAQMTLAEKIQLVHGAGMIGIGELGASELAILSKANGGAGF